MKIKIIAFLMFAVRLMQAADVTPTVTRYHGQDLIPVKSKVRFTTLVVFQEDEEIAEVSCGDKTYWVIDGKDNILHIKPTQEGLTTNVNVIMRSGAIYSFLLKESGTDGEPDLKLTIGPDRASILEKANGELNKALTATKADLTTARTALDEQKKQSREREQSLLAEAKRRLPEDMIELLAEQKADYSCFAKTDICTAAILLTPTSTVIIGHFVDTPEFGQYLDAGAERVPFQTKGNVYVLQQPVQRGYIRYHGFTVNFSMVQ